MTHAGRVGASEISESVNKLHTCRETFINSDSSEELLDPRKNPSAFLVAARIARRHLRLVDFCTIVDKGDEKNGSKHCGSPPPQTSWVPEQKKWRRSVIVHLAQTRPFGGVVGGSWANLENFG